MCEICGLYTHLELDWMIQVLFGHHPFCPNIDWDMSDRLKQREFGKNLEILQEQYFEAKFKREKNRLEEEVKKKLTPKPTKAVTEEKIIYKLYLDRFKKCYPLAPNVYLFNWESDLLSICKKNMATEYEVKISRADFKADVKKIDKHKVLSEAYNGSPTRERLPNFFYYAAPKGILNLEDIPEYAGWVEIGIKSIIMKEAPRLHRQGISEEDKITLLKKVYDKVWTLKKC
jgi:hypothetical protein